MWHRCDKGNLYRFEVDSTCMRKQLMVHIYMSVKRRELKWHGVLNASSNVKHRDYGFMQGVIDLIMWFIVYIKMVGVTFITSLPQNVAYSIASGTSYGLKQK